MSATVNKLVYGDLTFFTDDEIQDGEVYDAVALLSGRPGNRQPSTNGGPYIRDEGHLARPDRFPAE